MQIRSYLPAFGALLFVVAALPGCSTTGLFQGNPDEAKPGANEWTTTDPVSAPSLEIVWNRVRLVLAGEGYRVDERRTQFDERRIVTEWSTYLAPTRFEGVRRRAFAEILVGPTAAAESGAKGTVAPMKTFTLKLAVLKQRNADIDQPTNPTMAHWENVGVEPTRSALLSWKIQNAFAPRDPSDTDTDQ